MVYTFLYYIVGDKFNPRISNFEKRHLSPNSTFQHDFAMDQNYINFNTRNINHNRILSFDGKMMSIESQNSDHFEMVPVRNMKFTPHQRTKCFSPKPMQQQRLETIHRYEKYGLKEMGYMYKRKHKSPSKAFNFTGSIV